jgi:hypothetical protein
MMVDGTEYVVLMIPNFGGGGRYAQIKIELQKKLQKCVPDIQKSKKNAFPKAPTKIETP